jgi:TatA/E family protein of Tat protein translocase
VEYNKTMGTLGGQEMLVIIVLALLLFGPKELPKIARTLGKAMTEFRRAQNELKTTFSREMENLERETGVKELTATNYMADSYNYEFDGDDGHDPYYDASAHSSDTTTYEASASAIEGVEHVAGPLQIEAAADSVPNGHVYDAGHAEAGHADAADPPASIHNEASHTEAGNPVHG